MNDVHKEPKLGTQLLACVAAASVAFLLAMIMTYLMSPRPMPYAYHMSFNEWWYAGVVTGEIHDSLMPPGYVWAAKLWAMAPPIVSLRAVSLFATIGACLVIARTIGHWQAALFATAPWVALWSIRAQPDALMMAMVVAGLLLADEHEGSTMNNWFMGGFLIGLSLFVKPVGILAIVPLLCTAGGRRFPAWIGFTLGSSCFAFWASFMPTETWLYHLHKSVPFENLVPNSLFLVGGLGFLWYGLLWARLARPWALVGAAVFLLFAFVKAPWAHEYYLLPGLALLPLAFECPRFPLPIISGNAVLASLMILAMGPIGYGGGA